MVSDELKPGYECVHTVTDYCDGPRKGIANYQGKPHLFECIFDESKDNYSELFWLAPVDAETFRFAMEDWAIWQRWELAFHSGKTDISMHPALPHETVRQIRWTGKVSPRTNMDGKATQDLSACLGNCVWSQSRLCVCSASGDVSERS